MSVLGTNLEPELEERTIKSENAECRMDELVIFGNVDNGSEEVSIDLFYDLTEIVFWRGKETSNKEMKDVICM